MPNFSSCAYFANFSSCTNFRNHKHNRHDRKQHHRLHKYDMEQHHKLFKHDREQHHRRNKHDREQHQYYKPNKHHKRYQRGAASANSESDSPSSYTAICTNPCPRVRG